MGEKVTEFEKKYCKKYSYKHGVSNNSGSSANLLMLSVLTSKLTENNLKKGDEIILSTDKGRVIRCAVKEIRSAGRNTQGVRIFKLTGDEKVVSAIKVEYE